MDDDTDLANASPCTDIDENELIGSWDRDIRRAAHRTARRFGACEADADDFAQEARIRLLLAARRGNFDERGSGLRGEGTDPYVRKLIKTAILNALRRDRRLRAAWSAEHIPIPDDVEQVDGELEPEVCIDLASWVARQPARDRKVIELLYVDQRSEREAAKVLDLSHVSVNKINHRILERARGELALTG